MRRCATASLTVAALLVSAGAAASDAFPAAMVTELELETAPACDLCHQRASDPVGAADTPFARSAEARGLVAGDVASLAKALDRMRADGVDSDGDGAFDLDELWWGDPNHADEPLGGYKTPPGDGCSASPRPDGGTAGIGALMLLAFATRRAARNRQRPGR